MSKRRSAAATHARVPPPQSRRPLSRRAGLALAGMLATVFFAQGLVGSLDESLTWDEPIYVASGFSYLTRGDFRLNPEAPPLIQQLVGLPLLFLGAPTPRDDDPAWRDARQIEFGKQLLFRSGLDVRQAALWCRLPVLLLGATLVLMIYLWGSQIFGPAPALVAATVAAVEPNLLAHAKVATVDLGCTTLMFAAVWTLWRAVQSNRAREWALCGACTGLALLAKFTALLLGPIFAVLFAAAWFRRRHEWQPLTVLRNVAILAATGWFVIGSGYHLSFDGSLFMRGVGTVYTKMSPDYQFYLLGEISHRPWWYYYLVAFVLKVPLPVLGLLAFAAALVARDRSRSEAALFLLVPAAVVIGTSTFNRYNMGLRHILPAFPFLFLFAAETLAGRPRRWRIGLTCLLLAWTLLEAVRTYPHHLSYFNTLAGGPGRGPYLLDDSNIDWGQDLPALARWQEEHTNGTPLRLFYFGTADPAAYGVDSVPMAMDEIEHPRAGLYAVSAHILVYFRKRGTRLGRNLDWLTKYEPIARAGHSIYVYRFPATGG